MSVPLRAARRRGRSAPSPGPPRPAARPAPRSSATGTPVTRSTRSGHHAATDRAHVVEAGGARGDVVLVDRARRRSTRCSRPRASAQVGARAPAAGAASARSGGRRYAAGRSRRRWPPRSRSRSRCARPRRHRLGQVGADQHQHVGLLEVGQRERQPAVDPEGPVAGRRGRRHAEPAVVVDLAGAAARPGRTCRAGRPSRWSARRRRRPRPRPAPCAARSARSRPATRSSASSQVGRRAARRSPRSRTSGVVSRSRWPQQPGRGPALAAQRPLG